MKTKLGTALLVITAAVMLSAGVAHAACKPACKKGVPCRYDSTKKPPYWCDDKKGAVKGGKTGGISGGAGTRAPAKATTGVR